jgi:hypothetical protein
MGVIFYFLLQPFGQVPVVEDGDLRLFGKKPAKNNLSFFGVMQKNILILHLIFIVFIHPRNHAAMNLYVLFVGSFYNNFDLYTSFFS